MKDNSKTSKSRRRFITNGLKFGAILPIVSNTGLAAFITNPAERKFIHPQKKNPLKILLLGGTSFLGPHQIAYALERGHSITTFTRGKTKPTIHKELFGKVEMLIGDRENNLEALKGRKWDVVIDNSGRKAKWTEATARLLKDNASLYLYTSSTGVYYPYLGSNIKEEANPVLEIPEGINEIQKMEYGYGVMKANSEIVTRKEFGEDRTIVVRPTYMMGPGDKTDRFTYWPIRLAKGGEVLVPGKDDDPVQYIDVRDVAEWMIRLIENNAPGTFNAVGPASPTGMHAFVYGAHAAFNSKATFVTIPDYEFLKKHNVLDAIPWIMPIEDNAGSALVNNEHGVANGLGFRPLAESVRDIHEWWYSDAITKEHRTKFETSSLMGKEKAILADWITR